MRSHTGLSPIRSLLGVRGLLMRGLLVVRGLLAILMRLAMRGCHRNLSPRKPLVTSLLRAYSSIIGWAAEAPLAAS